MKIDIRYFDYNNKKDDKDFNDCRLLLSNYRGLLWILQSRRENNLEEQSNWGKSYPDAHGDEYIALSAADK